MDWFYNSCDRSQREKRDRSPHSKLAHFLPRLLSIKRTAHPFAAAIENMRVDHCRGDVLMAQQFLHRPDVVSALQQMCGEGMAKRMTGSRLGYVRRAHCILHGSLQRFFVDVGVFL